MTVQERRLFDHLILQLQVSDAGFEKELKRKHPKLTSHDLRLCSYLKANLSTKEIATILNITPDSVKKAKHRLRKKIKAEPTQSIQNCFD